jgi:hypothetical protein
MRRPSDFKHAALLWLLASTYVAVATVVVCLIHFGIGGVSAATVFDALIYAGAALVGMWAGLGRHSKTAGFAGVGASMAPHRGARFRFAVPTASARRWAPPHYRGLRTPVKRKLKASP